jgi:Protein of unknown function (DUF1579)
MSQKFENSLLEGQHQFLKSLEGNYKGITRVWFEPGVIGDESSCSGTLRSILGGRFLMHEYTGSMQGKPIEGVAIFGCSLGDSKLQMAWVDSFHNGTAIMFSENTSIDNPYSVMGYYGQEPRWGWRTQINRDTEGKVIITMFNSAPGGPEEKAVETIYEKVV